MALFLIGCGLGDARDLTLRAVEVLKRAEKVYLESYTSRPGASVMEYAKLLGRPVGEALREAVEEQAEQLLLLPALRQEIALLVPGDPLAATTHFALLARAKELDVEIHVLHHASVFTAIAETGLSLYKFGRTVTLPFGGAPSIEELILRNQQAGLHTLVLFDLSPRQNRYMTLTEAVRALRSLPAIRTLLSQGTQLVAAAALGTTRQRIVCGTAEQLECTPVDPEPRCLIIPGALAHHEEDALRLWRPHRES